MSKERLMRLRRELRAQKEGKPRSSGPRKPSFHIDEPVWKSNAATEKQKNFLHTLLYRCTDPSYLHVNVENLTVSEASELINTLKSLPSDYEPSEKQKSYLRYLIETYGAEYGVYDTRVVEVMSGREVSDMINDIKFQFEYY